MCSPRAPGRLTLFLEIIDAIIVHFPTIWVQPLDLEVATLVVERVAQFGYASYPGVTDLRDDKAGLHIGLVAKDAVADLADDYTPINTQFRGIVLAQIGEISPE